MDWKHWENTQCGGELRTSDHSYLPSHTQFSTLPTARNSSYIYTCNCSLQVHVYIAGVPCTPVVDNSCSLHALARCCHYSSQFHLSFSLRSIPQCLTSHLLMPLLYVICGWVLSHLTASSVGPLDGYVSPSSPTTPV